ncbi:MAG: Rmf/CrpP family protein [Pseudomonadota bacterium]
MQTINSEHRDTKAWEAGLKAGEEGKGLNKCPHSAGSLQQKSWQQGYSEGLARRKNSIGG